MAGSRQKKEKGGASVGTAQAEKRTVASFPLLDLDDAVLAGILSSLGPEPCHLAAAMLTCKRLHRIARESAWRELCYKLAPRICSDLVRPEESPPGGWQTLYKMFVWCPGIDPWMWWMEELTTGADDEELELRAHVQKRVPQLSATRGNKFLRPCLRGDKLYPTKLACRRLSFCEQTVCAYRGIFRDFPNSATWQKVKEEKVGYYMSVRMWDIGFGSEDWDIGHSLALNFASHYVIQGVGFTADPGEDPEEGNLYGEDDDSPHVTMAYVCENGHLCGAYRGEIPMCYDSDSDEELATGGEAPMVGLPVEAASPSDREMYVSGMKDPTVAVLKHRNPVHSFAHSLRNVFERRYNREVHRYLGPDDDGADVKEGWGEESSTGADIDEADSDDSESDGSDSDDSDDDDEAFSDFNRMVATNYCQ